MRNTNSYISKLSFEKYIIMFPCLWSVISGIVHHLFKAWNTQLISHSKIYFSAFLVPLHKTGLLTTRLRQLLWLVSPTITAGKKFIFSFYLPVIRTFWTTIACYGGRSVGYALVSWSECMARQAYNTCPWMYKSFKTNTITRLRL